MNLLESLQKTQTARATQPVPGQAANLRKTLAAKSGKANATSGPAISNIQEQQALSDFNQAATTQQQAAQLDVAQQNQQQQAQQQQATQGRQRLDAGRQKATRQFEQAVTKTTNDLDRLKTDITSKEGQAALSDAIVTRRLADEKYMAELNRQGVERRLDNSNDFAIEAAKTAFGNWEELFTDEEEFVKMMELDDAEFQKGLAKMSNEAADKILRNQIEANNRVSVIESYGNVANTAIQAGNTKYSTTQDGVTTEASFFERMGK